MVNMIALVSFDSMLSVLHRPRTHESLSLQGIVTLLQHPDQLKDLKADPSLANLFVEELCRYHTASAMALRRVAKVDIELRGKVRIRSPQEILSFVC